LEEELILLLVELDPLDDIGRTDALVQLGAVADVPELHLKIGAPVSHLDDMNLGRPHQAALILQYVAGPDFVAVDLHRGDLARKKAARKLTAWPGPRNRGPGEERPQASAVPSPRTRSIARSDWRHKASPAAMKSAPAATKSAALSSASPSSATTGTTITSAHHCTSSKSARK